MNLKLCLLSENTDSVTNPTTIVQDPIGSRIEQKTCSLAIAVEYQGVNVPGAQINFSTSDGVIMRSCTTSEVISQCSMSTQTCDGPYLITVIVPEGSGYSCQDSGCTAIFTLIPEKITEYTFVLIQEQVKGTVLVTTNFGECISGTVVEVSDSKNPDVILESMKTTGSVCNLTIATMNENIVYLAKVTPPNDTFICSGDFNSSCSATFQASFIEITIVQCILVIVVSPPMSSPTQWPKKQPTKRPTNTIAPTTKPTSAPSHQPSVSVPEAAQPVPVITLIPTESPTQNPTGKPSDPPLTLKPSVNPTEALSAITLNPTKSPTARATFNPTKIPVTLNPTKSPTIRTVAPITPNPTKSITMKPTLKPTEMPSKNPTEAPSHKPSKSVPEAAQSIPVPENGNKLKVSISNDSPQVNYQSSP